MNVAKKCLDKQNQNVNLLWQFNNNLECYEHVIIYKKKYFDKIHTNSEKNVIWIFWSDFILLPYAM